MTDERPRKMCLGCGTPKSLDDFYSDGRVSDGLYSKCKACHCGKQNLTRQNKAGVIPAAVNMDLRWRRALSAVWIKHCTHKGPHTGMLSLSEPCPCGVRAIWEKLLAGYLDCLMSKGGRNEVMTIHTVNGVSFCRKNEEYVADFEIMMRRITRYLDSAYDFEHQRIWKPFWVSNLPWNRCMPRERRTELWRGRFFTAARRIEENVVREAVCIQPYPLFPLQDYMRMSKDKNGDYLLINEAVYGKTRLDRVA